MSLLVQLDIELRLDKSLMMMLILLERAKQTWNSVVLGVVLLSDTMHMDSRPIVLQL